MATIEGFESITPAESLDEGLALPPGVYPYESILLPLSEGLPGIQVAGNVLARIAKKQFSDSIAPLIKHMRLTSEARNLRPQWMCQVSTTMNSDIFADPEEFSKILSKLVSQLAELLKATVLTEGAVSLVDSLSAEITLIGDNDYSFRFKQFWANGPTDE
jgi:hypothetical protein